MIRVSPPPEPPDFDQKARQPGNTWLDRNLDQNGKLPKETRPPDRWSAFNNQLCDGFQRRCGYLAMHITEGTVDHYLSCENHPKLAYEWDNYRYISGSINSSKRTLDEKVLDPFEVQDAWFEILLPSLQLVLTDSVPPEERERAQFTLEKLHLRDGEKAILLRQEWYTLYLEGDLTLKGLEKIAPLIARGSQETGRRKLKSIR
jgi:hypothetical protein